MRRWTWPDLPARSGLRPTPCVVPGVARHPLVSVGVAPRADALPVVGVVVHDPFGGGAVRVGNGVAAPPLHAPQSTLAVGMVSGRLQLSTMVGTEREVVVVEVTDRDIGGVHLLG